MKTKFLVVGLVSMSLFLIPTYAFAADGLNSNVPFIDNLADSALSIVQFIYWLVIAWTSIKLLRDRSYGQFWGFLIFALIVYMLIFQRSFLETVSNQFLDLFNRGGGSSSGGGSGGTGSTN